MSGKGTKETSCISCIYLVNDRDMDGMDSRNGSEEIVNPVENL